MNVSPPMPAEITDVYAGFSEENRAGLLQIREWVFAEAASRDAVGKISEELKWGEPSFVISNPRSGTTLRLAETNKRSDADFGVFVPCQTSLIETCRTQYADFFTYDKNRGLLFKHDEKLPEPELRHFIALALTYYVK